LVEHHVDLGGSDDGVGCKVISNTITTYEEEDNKKYDTPKSRPIRDLKFFDNIYQYARAEDLAELKVDPDAKGVWVKFGNQYVVLAPSHGRLERRDFTLLNDVSSYDIWEGVPEKLKDEWEAYIKGIGIATRYRAEPKKVTTGKGKDKNKETVYVGTVTRTVYMFMDPPESCIDFGNLTRGYWDIENVLHSIVDKELGQDACTCRIGNSTGNMSFLRKMAFNVLSSARNAIDEVHMSARRMPMINILDSLSKRSDLIVELLFGKPDEALINFAMNHCPSFD
jgi:predicted transposase YbfD/YdcC